MYIQAESLYCTPETQHCKSTILQLKTNSNSDTLRQSAYIRPTCLEAATLGGNKWYSHHHSHHQIMTFTCFALVGN